MLHNISVSIVTCELMVVVYTVSVPPPHQGERWLDVPGATAQHHGAQLQGELQMFQDVSGILVLYLVYHLILLHLVSRWLKTSTQVINPCQLMLTSHVYCNATFVHAVSIATHLDLCVQD